MEGCCEHCNELAGAKKGEEFNQLTEESVLSERVLCSVECFGCLVSYLANILEHMNQIETAEGMQHEMDR